MRQRICIYPSDVEYLTGKSNRTCRELLTKIKEHVGKAPHQLISYCEFAAYTGLKAHTVLKAINNMPLVKEEE